MKTFANIALSAVVVAIWTCRLRDLLATTSSLQSQNALATGMQNFTIYAVTFLDYMLTLGRDIQNQSLRSLRTSVTKPLLRQLSSVTPHVS